MSVNEMMAEEQRRQEKSQNESNLNNEGSQRNGQSKKKKDEDKTENKKAKDHKKKNSRDRKDKTDKRSKKRKRDSDKKKRISSSSSSERIDEKKNKRKVSKKQKKPDEVSKDKKNKQKVKKNKESKSKSKSKSRSRSRSRKDDKKKQKIQESKSKSKSKSKNSSSSPSPRRRKPSREERILKIMHQRRNQSRSKSVLRYYQRQQVRSNPKDDQNDRYWDGFQWVPKTNQVTKGKADNERVMSMTLKMRRIQICNVPTGISEQEVRNEVTRFMVENYLSDSGNIKPILVCTLNEKERTACIELSSVEESSRMLKLERIKLLDDDCKLIRMGEQVYNLKQVINPVQQSMQQAHNMAQAQAAAINALNNLGITSVVDREEMLEKAGVSTNIIKVSNFVTTELSKQLEPQEWEDMGTDLLEGFGKHGKIVDKFFVRPHQAGLGCEAGSLFVVYENKEQAEEVVQQMLGKRYNGRDFRIVFIQDRTWQKSYKPRIRLQPPEITQTKQKIDN